MKKIFNVVLLVTALLFIFTGCSKEAVSTEVSENTQQANETAEAVETPVLKELNLGFGWLPGNLDPAQGWNGWALCKVGAGENLVQMDENGAIKNVIAESYERIDDQTIEFTIREGVYFHNGKVVDAQACKVSIERALETTDRDDVYVPVESITADGMKLTIKTDKPFATLIANLTDPVYIIIDAEAAESQEEVKIPVATGAFKVVEFKDGEGIELAKHDQHWSGPIKVDLVHAIYIKDDSTRALALQSGELDVAVKIVPKDLALFNGDSNYTVQAGSNLRTGFVRLNMNKPYMQDKNFRMALHYGIDTATYADKILGCEPANGPFSSILPFSAKAEMPYKYNPEEAKRLLDEAGYVDTDGDGIREYMGTNLNLVYLGRSDNGGDTVNVATAIQAQLKEVGIGVQLTLVENHADLRDAGKFDLFNDAWVTAPTGDPEYFLRASFMTDGYGNCAYYGDEKLDGYVEKLANTMAIDERYAIGTEAAEYLVEDVAAIFINYRQGTVITKSNVHGVHRFLSGIYCLDERVYMD